MRDPTANIFEPPAEKMAPKADIFDNGKSLYATFLTFFIPWWNANGVKSSREYTTAAEDRNSVAKAAWGEDSDEPTEEELATLRHIGDKIPYSAWLVAVVELAE